MPRVCGSSTLPDFSAFLSRTPSALAMPKDDSRTDWRRANNWATPLGGQIGNSLPGILEFRGPCVLASYLARKGNHRPGRLRGRQAKSLPLAVQCSLPNLVFLSG